MLNDDIVKDAETLALQALAFVIGDEALRPRFLAVTGLGVEDLRARAGDRQVLAATLAFLAAHEPNLLAAAAALDVKPAALSAAAAALGA